MRRALHTVTLLGADCVDIGRLLLAADICEKGFEFADVKLLSSIPSDDKRVVQIDPITSTEEYSEFAIRNFVEYVETDHALIIQHDGFILNPDAWNDIFLEYDYIGAPWLVKDWSVRDFGFPKELLGTHIVGNGGFCLRSKRFLELSAEFSADAVITEHHPEDVVLAIHHRSAFEAAGMKFAPPEVGAQFSFEAHDEENRVWDGQFGFHGLKWTDISKWTREHPEYEIDNPAAKKSP